MLCSTDCCQQGPTEIEFLVEVAEWSSAFVQAKKVWFYATGGVSRYWVVDIVNRRILVYSQPSGPVYRQRQDFVIGDHVPVLLGEIEVGRIKVAELFL